MCQTLVTEGREKGQVSRWGIGDMPFHDFSRKHMHFRNLSILLFYCIIISYKTFERNKKIRENSALHGFF
jgi:hypothetical protein